MAHIVIELDLHPENIDFSLYKANTLFTSSMFTNLFWFVVSFCTT